jgi:hypothetical protein
MCEGNELDMNRRVDGCMHGIYQYNVKQIDLFHMHGALLRSPSSVTEAITHGVSECVL